MADETSDWIKWSGGECPVDKDAIVKVRMRAGGSIAQQPAEWYDWGHDVPGENRNFDIIAYRVVSE